jgi:hypothetical protein
MENEFGEFLLTEADLNFKVRIYVIASILPFQRSPFFRKLRSKFESPLR